MVAKRESQKKATVRFYKRSAGPRARSLGAVVATASAGKATAAQTAARRQFLADVGAPELTPDELARLRAELDG